MLSLYVRSSLLGLNFKAVLNFSTYSKKIPLVTNSLSMVKITFKNQADLAITCGDCLFLLYQDSAQDVLEDDLRTVCQLIVSKKTAKRWFC